MTLNKDIVETLRRSENKIPNLEYDIIHKSVYYSMNAYRASLNNQIYDFAILHYHGDQRSCSNSLWCKVAKVLPSSADEPFSVEQLADQLASAFRQHVINTMNESIEEKRREAEEEVE